MGLFDIFKNKDQAVTTVVTFPVTLGAPAKGTVVPMAQISDEVFSSGVLGICCGIEPEEGKVFAPMDGKICQITDTLHAIALESDGIEVLIHVGIDTVNMNGDGFSNVVQLEQTVKKGELLLTMDIDKIHTAGYAATVIMAVVNSHDFASVEEIASGKVRLENDILRIEK